MFWKTPRRPYHLFQGPAFRLPDEEPCPYEGQQAEDGEEDVCSEVGVLNERRRDESLIGELEHQTFVGQVELSMNLR